jgi:DNA-binding FrmR family transcriptional regulator
MEETMEKKSLQKDIAVRLRRIQGQVKGIEKMVDCEVCCKDVLVQIAAIRAANNKVGALLVENFAKSCVVCESSEDTTNNIDQLVNTLLLFLKGTEIPEEPVEEKDLKAEILVRLKRIQVQVESIEKLIQTEACCKKILVQIASVREGINKVGALLVENYAKSCLVSEDQEATNKNIDGLVATILTFLK